MPKIDDKHKTQIIHLKRPAFIELPMVILPLAEYEELLEDAEVAKSKKLTNEIKQARKSFAKGEGRSLEDAISGIEGC